MKEYDQLVKLFSERLKSLPDNMFHEAISQGALQLPVDLAETVTFVFWICYLAETELTDVIREAWTGATKGSERAEVVVATKLLAERIEKVFGPKARARLIGSDEVFDPSRLEYFTDKIMIYEASQGATRRSTILWSLKELRNDVGHNRIDTLMYNGDSLNSREAKYKLVMDYFASIGSE